MTPAAAADTLGRNELSRKFLNSEFARAPYNSWTMSVDSTPTCATTSFTTCSTTPPPTTA